MTARNAGLVRGWALGLLLAAACALPAEPADVPAPEKPPLKVAETSAPPAPPYVFSLGGLTADEVENLKKVPGVQGVKPGGNRVQVTWETHTQGPDGKWTWIEGCDKLYDFLAIKKVLGKTEWTHGGMGQGRAGTILNESGSVCWRVMFNDSATKHNEIMLVHCYQNALPGQIEHEMLRFVAGTTTKTEQCGVGYVLVSRGGRGVCTAWQVSSQIFVRIDNSFDREMVTAYVGRLGSIIPKDYKVSVDKWVENEIRWRFAQIDWYNARGKQSGPGWGRAGTIPDAPYVWNFFPDTLKLKGQVDFERATPAERWEWLNWARHWLWANRANLKYDDASRGYILKGKDLYDPKNPPELPEELRGPPRPQPEPEKKPADGSGLHYPHLHFGVVLA